MARCDLCGVSNAPSRNSLRLSRIEALGLSGMVSSRREPTLSPIARLEAVTVQP